MVFLVGFCFFCSFLCVFVLCFRLIVFTWFLEFIGFGCEPILVDWVFQISLKFHVDFWQVSFFQFSKQKSNQCNGWESYSKCKSSYSIQKSQIKFHVTIKIFQLLTLNWENWHNIKTIKKAKLQVKERKCQILHRRFMLWQSPWSKRFTSFQTRVNCTNM